MAAPVRLRIAAAKSAQGLDKAGLPGHYALTRPATRKRVTYELYPLGKQARGPVDLHHRATPLSEPSFKQRLARDR